MTFIPLCLWCDTVIGPGTPFDTYNICDSDECRCEHEAWAIELGVEA
jgi:hypothetical protein